MCAAGSLLRNELLCRLPDSSQGPDGEGGGIEPFLPGKSDRLKSNIPTRSPANRGGMMHSNEAPMKSVDMPRREAWAKDVSELAKLDRNLRPQVRPEALSLADILVLPSLFQPRGQSLAF